MRSRKDRRTDVMNDTDYAARQRALAAQLNELEREAGIGDLARGWRDAMDLSADAASAIADDGAGSEHSANPYPTPPSSAERRGLRVLYFGVLHPALRRSLIAKQRELELFERTETRTRLEDARRQVESLRRRPAEGWWIAAIAGATLVIVGYVLFALLGAIAAGVAALFVGNGIEQSARRRYEQALALAEEDLSAAIAAATAAEHSRDLFSEGESATGQPDRALEGADDIGARTH
jgi:hypothetical protein